MKALLWLIGLAIITSAPADRKDNNIETMLFNADELLKKREYRSAANLAIEIQNLALKEQKDIAYVRAANIELQSQRYFQQNDIKTLLEEINKKIEKGFKRTPALLHTIKIATVSSWYQSRQYQFRHNLNDGILNENPNEWSQEDIWKYIDQELQQAIKKGGDQTISADDLQHFSYANNIDEVKPSKISDLSILTAINAISRFTSTSIFNSDKLYVEVKPFIEEFKEDKTEHPTAILARYYVWLLDQETKDQTLWNHYNLMRLNTLYQKDEAYNRIKKYEQALFELLTINNPAQALASAYLARVYNSYSMNYNPEKTETKKWKTYQQKAINLCNTAIKKYPKSFGAVKCKNLLENIYAPIVQMEFEQYSTPGKPLPIRIEYKNEKYVDIEIYRLNAKEFMQAQRRNNDIPRNSKPEITHRIELPKVDDLYRHSVIDILPSLKEGFYQLTLKPEKEIETRAYGISTSTINITQIAIISKGIKQGIEANVIDRNSGQDIEIDEAASYKSQYDRNTRMSSFTETDKYEVQNGIFIIPTKNRNHVIQISAGADTIVSDIWGSYPYRRQERIKKKMNFFTDRAIYRPGQTVHFKGILSSKKGFDYQPVSNESVQITFYNANYKEITKKTLKTNEFGSISGSFSIPNQGRTGDFRLRTNFGSTYIRVEEYKRPTFKAEFKANEKPAIPGDKVTIDLLTTTYSGATINNAKVETTVKMGCPYFKYWYPSSGETVVLSRTDKTNNKGIARIEFESLKDNTSQIYYIESQVTLPGGETHTFNYTYTVSSQPIVFDISYQDDVIDATKSPGIKISGINGEIITEKSKLIIRKLKAPRDIFLKMPFRNAEFVTADEKKWRQHFPNTALNKELDPSTFKTQKKVYEIEDVASKINLDKFKPIEGWYAFELKLADTVYSTKYIEVIDPGTKSIKQPVDFVALANKKEVKPGERVTITFSSSLKNGKIRILVLDKEGELMSKTISINQKKESLDIDINSRSEGYVIIDAVLIHSGHELNQNFEIKVVPVSRQLTIETKSIRKNILPGAKEEWSFTVKKNGSTAQNTEVVASMYDKSLDVFKTDKWGNPYKLGYFGYSTWEVCGIQSRSLYLDDYEKYDKTKTSSWYINAPFTIRTRYGMVTSEEIAKSPVQEGETIDDEVQDKYIEEEVVGTSHPKNSSNDQNIAVRTNFNETAFFYPALQTNENGELTFSFIAPEAMTEWNLQLFAHDKTMAAGYFTENIITQKPLMVIPNKPRFLHQGDSVVIDAMVYNLEKETIDVEPKGQAMNPVTGNPLNIILSDKKISIKAGQSKKFSMAFAVPEGISALTFQMTGKTGNATDGEEHTIRVYQAKKKLINTLALWCPGRKSKNYTFASLDKLNSPTATNHQLTLEMTTNPVWMAIKSLPTINKPGTESAVQQAYNIMVATLGSKLLKDYPEIPRVLKVWRDAQPEALASKLSKNPELKTILLEETPWEQISDNETLQRQALIELLDKNYIDNSISSAISKLEEQQNSSGAFSWLPGMSDSYYFTLKTTLYLSKTFNSMESRDENRVKIIVKKAERYLDKKTEEVYSKLLKYNIDTAKYVTSSYLLSYFEIKYNINNRYRPKDEIHRFFWLHAKNKYKNQNLYQQVKTGQLALLFEDQKTVQQTIKRLKERAVIIAEEGMHWQENQYGWNWDEAPIETQAAIINLFNDAGQPQPEIDAMKLWLIRQKQGQQWQSNTGTLDAVSTLIRTGKDWLTIDKPVTIKLGNLEISSDKIEAEAGSGYFKHQISNPKSQMAKISLKNPNKPPVWGGIYHSYTEDYANIEPWQDELKIVRTIYKIDKTDQGEKAIEIKQDATLKKGDLVRVKLSIESNRELDYVWVSSPHAACFESREQLSGYQWRSGLSHYIEPRDNEQRIFINHLNDGSYALYYDLYVERDGKFQSAPATIQSVYAPEFGAHSKGYSVSIGN